ncbi:SCP2 sterol-binding domain-containing protein [Xenorhabdus sp. 42]|nr:SCP2 sterol-binding domain-containing protein [Xenorhabdus sp. 42]
MLSKIHSHLVVRQYASEDVSLSGDLNDFVLIAARREDPDTLFFQHRLHIEGNTELGLHVKNLMDSIELESMPSILRFGVLQLAEFIKAGQKEGVDQHDRALSSC